MPRLPTPVSRPKLPEAIFTPESQGAAAARGQAELADTIQRGGVQLGQQIEQRKTQKEISQLNAEFAKTQAELTVAWQETLRTADPNDDTVAENFRQNVLQPRVEALADFAQTRESKAYYQKAAAGLGAGFLVTTEAGQAGLRETAAVQNWEISLNQMGDAVMADPASFDTSMIMVDLQLEGLIRANGLSREKALVLETEARKNLAVGAATGLIMKDPDFGRAEIESGKFSEYLDAGDKARLLSFADSQKRAQEAAAEKARQRYVAGRQAAFVGAAVSKNGTINTSELPAILGEIAHDPAFREDPAAQRAMFNFIDALADEASGDTIKTDPIVFDNFLARTLLPPGDPRRPTRNEIYSAVSHGITREDSNFLVARIDEEGSPRERAFNDMTNETARAARSFITGSSTLDFVDDPNAIRNYLSWVNFAMPEIERMRQEGKTPTEIFAPDSPIMQFQNYKRKLSMEEQSQLMAGRMETQVITSPAPDKDPFAFEDPRATATPALRAGPDPGASFNGKPLKDLTPAEMDKWLKENP